MISFLVNLNFDTSETASGTINIAETGQTSYDIAFELEWEFEIPSEGSVRSGKWSGSFNDPIYLSLSIDILSGIAEKVTYVVMDSATLVIGSTYPNDPAEIGGQLDFSVGPSIDVNVLFDGYMEASGTATLDLTSGDQDVSLVLDWSPLLP